MTESHHQEIVTFSNSLPTLRQTVNDQELLNRCQQYLTELLDLSKNDALEADPPSDQPAQ
jgi:hypothetical protein